MTQHQYCLFGLICSPQLTEQRANLLRARTAHINDWSGLPTLAARHQIGPLFYWHLKAYGIAYPQEIRRAMAAMYARQKAVASVQSQTLAEIIRAFDGAGVGAVVIKGGALAHIVYAEPGLRPMEDLDILIEPAQASVAHGLLLDLGFHAPVPKSRYDFLQHHMPLAQRTRDNVTVNVELHTAAFNLLMQDKLSIANMLRPSYTYSVLEQSVQTLNPVQMLWMQYLGLRKLAEPMRQIHLADLVGMAERLLGNTDWVRLRQDYPDLWNAYEAIHAFSPLSGAVCEQLELRQDPPPKMKGIGEDFHGWPRQGLSQKNAYEKCRLIHRSLFPPEWWARLIYGVRTNKKMANILFYHHPSAFLQQGMRRLYLGPVNPSGFFKNPV